MEIIFFYMTSVVCGRCSAFSSVSSELITLLIKLVEEGWASNLILFGDGSDSDELCLRDVMGDDEDGGGALMIGGITNWDTGFKLKDKFWV